MFASTSGNVSVELAERRDRRAIRSATWLCAAFSSVAATAIGSLSIAMQRRAGPALDRGDREDARAAADVEDARRASTPRSASVLQLLEHEPRARVGAGAERHAGIEIDHDVAGLGARTCSQLGTTTNWRVSRLTLK